MIPSASACLTAADGDPWIALDLAMRWPEIVRGRPTGHLLTADELAVLQAIADGGTTTSIAEDTARSENTIKSHAKKIRSKLAANTITQAVAIAWRLGLIV